jgi:prevent-host-death family protein
MISIKQDTTLVGVSELRVNLEKILRESKKHKVLIERRNKPIAVLMDIEKYDQMEATLELLEDVALGYLAKERDAKTPEVAYLNLQDVKSKMKRR